MWEQLLNVLFSWPPPEMIAGKTGCCLINGYKGKIGRFEHYDQVPQIGVVVDIAYKDIVSYEYRTKLGMTKVVLRGSWGCHHCKTDRGPP